VHCGDLKAIPTSDVARDNVRPEESPSTNEDVLDKTDVERTLSGLCGLAGIAPDSRDRKTWIGHAEFADQNSLSSITDILDCIPAHTSETFLNTIRRVQRSLERFCWAVGLAQVSGLCCDSFTVLRKVESGSGFFMIEMCRISFERILELRHEFLRILENSLDVQSEVSRCREVAARILNYLDDRSSGVRGKENLRAKRQNPEEGLHMCALAIQFLSLGGGFFFISLDSHRSHSPVLFGHPTEKGNPT
jgi:hypothetical protein